MPNNDVDLFESRTLYKGEIRRKGITVSRVDGLESFTISSATYTITDLATKQVIEGPSDATIDGKNVYIFVDTTRFTGEKYQLEFTYAVDGSIGKARIRFKVVA